MQYNDIKFFLGLEDPDLIFLNKWEETIKNRKIKFVELKKKRKSYRCPDCGKWVNRIHDYRVACPMHINVANHPCRLVLHKRRFRCKHCDKRFLEPWDLIDRCRRVTKALIKSSLMDLMTKISFTDIGKKYGLSINTIMRDFYKYVNFENSKIQLPEVISVDEFKATSDEGHYAFMVTDPVKKDIIDILPNRLKTTIRDYFMRFDNRHEVKVVIGDMWDTYKDLTKDIFPNAIYIADRFHYVRHISWAFTDVRVRVQGQLLANKDLKGYKFIKNKVTVGLLNKCSDKVTVPEDWDYTYNSRTKEFRLDPLQRISKAISLNDDLRVAYHLKERFFEIIHNSTHETARQDLIDWIRLCRDSEIKEFLEVSKTITNWLDEIVNSFAYDKQFSNGFIEGCNNKIKVIKRISFGYRLFDNFRNRIMYIFGNPIQG